MNSSKINKEILTELNKIIAFDIMIPRSECSLISIDYSYQEIVKIITKVGFSRYPVYRDKVDNIIGILYAKDLLKYLITDEKVINFNEILRKPLFISENKKAGDLLLEFKRERIHIAIVVDEYGTMLGIVTLEDVLELIVGDITDEFDMPEDDNKYKIIGKDEYIISPKMEIKVFNELFKTRITSEDFETIGGFILERFGHLPSVGESFIYSNFKFEILKVEGSFILEVKITKV